MRFVICMNDAMFIYIYTCHNSYELKQSHSIIGTQIRVYIIHIYILHRTHLLKDSNLAFVWWMMSWHSAALYLFLIARYCMWHNLQYLYCIQTHLFCQPNRNAAKIVYADRWLFSLVPHRWQIRLGYCKEESDKCAISKYVLYIYIIVAYIFE